MTAITRERALRFLYDTLPQSDLDTYSEELFLAFLDHALALRISVPWCAALDEEIFLHYVLCPRVNDEDLSFHRALFHGALWERIASLPSVEEMALEVNRWCCAMASYEMQDDRTASPLTVFRCGSGRCGEESAFLVSALRSVGIPARQVYAQRWAHCDDNHAWVEVLCGGTWRFLGACEPEPVLDRGWFNAPASRAPLVRSRLFGKGASPLHGDYIGTEGAVSWYNQTGRYAPTALQTITVLHTDGTPVPDARVEIQILNESAFFTVATLKTDDRGRCSLALGLGDIHIFAAFGENFAETDCPVGAEVTLIPAPLSTGNTPWVEYNVSAPETTDHNPSPLGGEQKRARREAIAHCRALRESRIAAMCPERDPLLLAARGNYPEIAAFLRRDSDPRRRTLLEALTAKDLRDVSRDTLNDHLSHLPPQGELPEELYIPYVLSPRIGLEPLTPWRSTLQKADAPTDPAALWGLLSGWSCPDNVYENLVWTPDAAWHEKAGGCRSRRTLWVAILRAKGIPARLRPLDGAPEFWKNGWHTPYREETVTLSITAEGTPLYRQNWSLSRFENGGWSLLNVKNEDRALTLPAGYYRLITSVRLPSGNQFALRRELTLTPGTVTETDLPFRSAAFSDLLRCQTLPPMAAKTAGGGDVANIFDPTGRPGFLFWLEEGGEPTEHVLEELMAARELPEDITFLLRSPEAMEQRTVRRALRVLPHVRVLFDDWDFDLDAAARHLTCDGERPPLSLVVDGEGRVVYADSGYSVGRIRLMNRIAAGI